MKVSFREMIEEGRLGSLHFGAQRQEMIAALGRPEVSTSYSIGYGVLQFGLRPDMCMDYWGLYADPHLTMPEQLEFVDYTPNLACGVQRIVDLLIEWEIPFEYADDPDLYPLFLRTGDGFLVHALRDGRLSSLVFDGSTTSEGKCL